MMTSAAETSFFAVDVDRNAAPVVRHGHGFVGVYGDHHSVAMTRQGLVDRVVDHFEDHVVQAAAVVGIADIHSRTLADSVEAF